MFGSTTLYQKKRNLKKLIKWGWGCWLFLISMKKIQDSKQDELNCEFEGQLIAYTLCNGINWLNWFFFPWGMCICKSQSTPLEIKYLYEGIVIKIIRGSVYPTDDSVPRRAQWGDVVMSLYMKDRRWHSLKSLLERQPSARHLRPCWAINTSLWF